MGPKPTTMYRTCYYRHRQLVMSLLSCGRSCNIWICTCKFLLNNNTVGIFHDVLFIYFIIDILGWLPEICPYRLNGTVQ